MPKPLKRSPRGVMTKVFDCSLEVSEFELNYIHFNTLREGMNLLILPTMG